MQLYPFETKIPQPEVDVDENLPWRFRFLNDHRSTTSFKKKGKK
jgi:hypothetical protein